MPVHCSLSLIFFPYRSSMWKAVTEPPGLYETHAQSGARSHFLLHKVGGKAAIMFFFKYKFLAVLCIIIQNRLTT